MTGSDFIARVRLTRRDGTLIAEAGQSCDRIPAPTGEGHSLEETLRALEASGAIEAKALKPETAPRPAPAAIPVAPDDHQPDQKGGE